MFRMADSGGTIALLTGAFGVLLGASGFWAWKKARRDAGVWSRLERGAIAIGLYGPATAKYFPRWFWLGSALIALYGLLGVSFTLEARGVDVPLIGTADGDFYLLALLVALMVIWLLIPHAAYWIRRIHRARALGSGKG